MVERIRILMVGPFPKAPERVVGGVEAAAYAVACALSQHEAVENVLALYVGTDPPPGYVVNDKLRVEFVRVPFVSGDSLIRSWFAVRAIRKISAKFRPHIVHGQGIGRAGDIAVQIGPPAVVTVHGMVHVEARVTERNLVSGLKAIALDRVVEAVLAEAKVTISISAYDAEELGTLIKGQQVSIPNAVPDEFFDAQCGLEAKPIILFAGLFRERKNLLGLVNAFATVRNQVPAARLILAGPTHSEAYLEAVRLRIEELGLESSVELPGNLSTDELIDALISAKVLALFSTQETLPTIIAQAMAVGRPVVAADVGGVASMVADGETGFVVPSDDEDQLAARLVQLLTDHELASAFGARGSELAKARYTARSVAERTLDAYRLAMA